MVTMTTVMGIQSSMSVQTLRKIQYPRISKNQPRYLKEQVNSQTVTSILTEGIVLCVSHLGRGCDRQDKGGYSRAAQVEETTLIERIHIKGLLMCSGVWSKYYKLQLLYA